MLEIQVGLIAMKIPLKITSKTILLFITVLLFNLSPLAPLENETKAYTAPGYNGTFVYYSFRDGASGIYRMDNGIETQILANPAPSGPVTWSPDGQYLYLTATSGGNGDIYRMRPDGTELTRLTTAPGSDYGPTISKDGTKLVFRSVRDGTNEIYIMNTDGTEQTRVTNNSTTEFNPEISPDNTKIAFYDTRYGTDEIFTINVDGSGEQRLTNNDVMDFAPKWSSDGTRIGYTSRPDGHNEVYVMNADGTNQTRLTISITNAPFGNWSITGETIYYLLDGDFYSMDSDGSNKVKILEDSEHPELQPFMSIVGPSPDGRYLVFESSALISPTIYTLNLTDLSISQIVDTPWSGAQGAGFQPLPNTPPVLATKTTTLQSGTSRLVDVLAGATDEEALSGSNIAITGAPAHGSASVEAGKVRYAADSGYVGVDSVGYEVCDSFLLDQKCSTKTLGITVTPALGVTKINGENYDAGVASYATPSLRPAFSGIATPGAEVTVEIHSDPIILTATADGSGNWSVTPTFDLPSGEHMVYISATLNGITTELDSFGLVVGGLAETGEPILPVLTGSAVMGIAGAVLVLYKLRGISQRTEHSKRGVLQ